jgi:putative membrane protein
VPAAGPSPDHETVDASRRTYLATERTLLAWWRTGLTALAVALAVGRVVPELGGNIHRWPYTVVGIGFGVYGIALIAYGTARARLVEEAMARGEFASTPDRILGVLTAAGVVLGLATLVVIAAD